MFWRSDKKREAKLPFFCFAERVGFEPTVRLHVHTLSRRASSATPAPFRKNLNS